MGINIFVEGTTDEKFIGQYIEYCFNTKVLNTNEYKIIKCNGKDNLFRDAYLTQLQKGRIEGRTNLVIFDADDDFQKRKQEILEKKRKDHSIDFDLFLFPNNKDNGTIETMLENIINPANQCIFDCWHKFEKCLEKQTISWKEPPTPTTPANKTKIYAYLETLVGTTANEKKKIKDGERDYCNSNHWKLDHVYLNPLEEFLKNYF